MATMNKRATIYFDPEIHRILRLKAAETERSISDIVNDALKAGLAQDQEDLAVFEARAKEQTMSYEALLKKLKSDGKISS
jgi:plasmid stability protein